VSTKARRSQKVMSPSLSPVCPQIPYHSSVFNQPSLCSPRAVLILPFLLPDDTFADLSDGKLDGQKAFMTGKLKTKGNMMLATKLGPVLATARPKAKL